MNNSTLLPLSLIALGGVAVAMQAPLNAALSRTMGSPLGAATVSFGLGFLALALLTLASSGLEPASRLGAVPLWQFAGGLLGAYYVWSVLSGVAALGVVTAMAGMILGQLTAGLLIDHFGAFGVTVHAISPRRLLAVGLVAAGLVLSRL
ncbi:MAG: DMT family transporter [Paracoccaceae bacterium]